MSLINYQRCFTVYKTIIVEDDLMVCSILEKQLGKFTQLKLAGASAAVRMRSNI